MINNKEKKMIQRYCIYPKIAVVALIFSFVQCALIVPLEMIDDLVFQNKGFQPTGMFTALGFVIISRMATAPALWRLKCAGA